LALVNDDRIGGHRPEFEIPVRVGELRHFEACLDVSDPAKGQVAGEFSVFLGPAGRGQLLFDILLQLLQPSVTVGAADPYDSGASSAKVADGFHAKFKTFMPSRNVFDYIADLDSLFILNLAEELERQVYGVRVCPFDVASSCVKFALKLLLEVAQGFSDLFANIYGYEYPHSDTTH
jgi:hypothetical protein